MLSPLDGGWRLFPETADTAGRQALAWGLAEHASFAHGAWAGVCSLWRGDAVARCGDAAALRCALLPCVYVGPALAPREGELPLPLANLQARIAARSSSRGMCHAYRPKTALRFARLRRR